MKLTEKPQMKHWAPIHYVFIEKIGPFQETAQKAWESLHEHVADIARQVSVTGFLSLYKIEPQMLYRAGVSVDEKPVLLPEGLRYQRFEGGKYACFTLTGSYSQLPEACGKVFEIVEKTGLPIRDDFFIENYLNDPKKTPEDQLLTEILIPTT